MKKYKALLITACKCKQELECDAKEGEEYRPELRVPMLREETVANPEGPTWSIRTFKFHEWDLKENLAIYKEKLP